MSWSEKPPILTGRSRDDLQNIRDYLFRMAQSLSDAAGADTGAVTITHAKDGTQVLKPAGSGSGATMEDVRRNARELQALIIKSANELGDVITAGDTRSMQYADSKVDQYNSMYVAKSEFGTFQENLSTTIETSARGVVESYGYDGAIQSVQDGVDLLQAYYTSIQGEIRRGIVIDPDTGDYVTGIAIAQRLQFSGECGPADQHNPGDGYTYYYMTEGQTFGLYTSTGWQFWIDGYKKGWYSATDGMLHIANVLVENTLQIGDSWQIMSLSGNEIELRYVGS